MHPISKMIPRTYDPKFWIKFDQSQDCIRRGKIRYIEFMEERDMRHYYKCKYDSVMLEMLLSFDYIDFDFD